MNRLHVVCTLCGRTGHNAAADCPIRPSSLAKQIADAQAEYATWTPERKAGVVLQGSSMWLRP